MSDFCHDAGDDVFGETPLSDDGIDNLGGSASSLDVDPVPTTSPVDHLELNSNRAACQDSERKVWWTTGSHDKWRVMTSESANERAAIPMAFCLRQTEFHCGGSDSGPLEREFHGRSQQLTNHITVLPLRPWQTPHKQGGTTST